MTEYYPVSVGNTLSYDGYFDFAKVMRLVKQHIEKLGYVYQEIDHNEIIKEEGKDIHVHLDCDRDVSDYVLTRLVVFVNVSGLKEVEVDKDGKKLYLNDGKISFEFEAYVNTDYEGRYEGKSFLFFLRTTMEKFVYHRQLLKFKHMVQMDLDDTIKEIKAYLNLFSLR